MNLRSFILFKGAHMLDNAASTPGKLPYQDLEEKVWVKDLCAGCRACITVCPSNTLAYDEATKKPYQYTPCVDCKACLDACPRMPANLDKLFSTDIIGPYLEIKSARAKTTNLRSQNGGAVTALLTAALDEGLIDAALVMGADRWLWKARPKVVFKSEDLKNAAGSTYTSNEIMESLKDYVKDPNVKNIAIVGTPCTIQAIGLLRTSSNEYAVKLAQKLRFVLGLFCFESFDDSLLAEVTKRLGVPSWRIEKMNAGEGKLTVTLRGGAVHTLPLSSLAQHVKPGCHVCADFTSKFSDISIGSVGSGPGNSTIVVRTPEGKGLFDIAVEKGLLEVSGEADLNAIDKVGKLKLKRNGL